MGEAGILYCPLLVHKWGSLIHAKNGIPITVDNAGIGFIPVYSDYEACRRDYPEREIITFETGEEGEKK